MGLKPYMCMYMEESHVLLTIGFPASEIFCFHPTNLTELAHSHMNEIILTARKPKSNNINNINDK